VEGKLPFIIEQSGKNCWGDMEAGLARTLNGASQVEQSLVGCLSQDADGSDNRQTASFCLTPSQKFIDIQLNRIR
jgi:hypothetical protein